MGSQITPFSLFVSTLLGSCHIPLFSFSRKKSQNRTVQQPGNLMAFLLTPQPIPLSFLNSRVSCVHKSSLQEEESLDEKTEEGQLCKSFLCLHFCWHFPGTSYKSAFKPHSASAGSMVRTLIFQWRKARLRTEVRGWKFHSLQGRWQTPWWNLVWGIRALFLCSFFQCWRWNPGPCTCEASSTTELQPQPSFLSKWVDFMSVH
jgi:hypothetical protein